MPVDIPADGREYEIHVKSRERRSRSDPEYWLDARGAIVYMILSVVLSSDLIEMLGYLRQ